MNAILKVWFLYQEMFW